MIKQNCVLILGAGASAEYGFPCGASFRQKLLETANHQKRWANKTRLIVLTEFEKRFRESTLSSIDRFLGDCRNRSISGNVDPDHLVNVGKEMIARVLLPYEGSLIQSPRDGWYGRLFESLTKDMNGSANHEQKRKITIVTFNYDRSLEYCLWKAFAAMGGEKGASQTMETFVEIVHAYGSLGLLPEQRSALSNYRSEIPYVGFGNEEKWQTAASGIGLIGERSSNSIEFKIRKCVENAEFIAFLGFGFLDENQNLRLLDLDRPRGKACVSSGYGITEGMRFSLRSAGDLQRFDQHNPPNRWFFGGEDRNMQQFLADSDLFRMLARQNSPLRTFVEETHKSEFAR